jgi:Lon protease-like protein
MPLPLHIFEPRYRALVADCLAQQEEFGVVLAKAEGMASVGCTAEIIDVVKKYPDGRMDIATVGRRRFRVLELVQGQAYLEGQVNFLRDEEEPEAATTSSEELEASCAEILALMSGEPSGKQEFRREQLSFQIAGLLPLELSVKQTLLELTSESERRRTLVQEMEGLAQRLRRLKRIRAVASGNGHGAPADQPP